MVTLAVRGVNEFVDGHSFGNHVDNAICRITGDCDLEPKGGI
ncbi:MAG TPA: hypothetical protein VFO31_25920 [Vicinamibacterales bacterium]|nr:hypothetical protein [Vicinamibacterales bacterium]